jgi:WbqC-like protein family
MKLGVMQPYFFPYVGYFDLINRVDRWVVFDTAQYIRHGWINRNRILHPTSGWNYVIAPVIKHQRDTPINQIQTLKREQWAPRILGQMLHYKKRAPYFRRTFQFVEDCLQGDERNLARLNAEILAKTCAFIGIPFNSSIFSEMNLPLSPVLGPGDWALRISEAMGATEYFNPPGGAELFDSARFATSGIKLTLQEPVTFSYACQGYTFEPSLSIIDVLMWVSPTEIKQRLDDIKAGVVPKCSDTSIL